MIMKTYYILVALGLFGTSLAQNPGFRTAVTSKGLDYIDTVGIPILEQKLSDLDIEDVTGTTSVPILGDIDYTLSNIQLFDLNIPTSNLQSSTSGLTVEASGISMSASADWSYNQEGWPYIDDSGTADLSVDSVSLSVTAIVEKDAQGHATLSTTGCSFDIGGISVEFHGGASWLYNLFDGSIASAIKDDLQDQTCSAATQAINDQGSGALESLPIMVKVDHIAEVTYALLSDPIFNTDYIETQHKGEFLYIANPVDSTTFSPRPLPAISSYDKMMYVWLTEEMANSAGIVYHKAGILQFTVTPEMVPKAVPIRLNTESFKDIIPALYKAFPKMDIEIFANATKPPVLKVVPNSADFTLVGELDVSVIHPNKTKTRAFVLGLTIHTDVRVWVQPSGNDQVITANCTLLKFNLTLASTRIGDFSTETLNQYMNFLITPLISVLNRYGKNGLIIPVIDGISFVQPEINLGQGYIIIGSDVNYAPTVYTKL